MEKTFIPLVSYVSERSFLLILQIYGKVRAGASESGLSSR